MNNEQMIDKSIRTKRSQTAEIWKRLKKNKLAVVGLGILLVLILTAIFADFIAPYAYDLQNYDAILESPSSAHIMGTDEFGRDIFSRVVYGSRISLWIGFISLTAGALVGCILGAIAGFFGGYSESIIMRCCDVLMSIPRTVLAIAIAASLEPGLTSAMIAVAASSIPSFARVVRASTLTVKDQEYIEAAVTVGASNKRIIIKHIMPNILAPIIVQATLGVGTAILMAASLSFLGIGIAPPSPEWGALLASGRTWMRDYPYIVIAPGLAIMLTVLGLNLFGDGLRDAMDPKLKK